MKTEVALWCRIKYTYYIGGGEHSEWERDSPHEFSESAFFLLTNLTI